MTEKKFELFKSPITGRWSCVYPVLGDTRDFHCEVDLERAKYLFVRCSIAEPPSKYGRVFRDMYFVLKPYLSDRLMDREEMEHVVVHFEKDFKRIISNELNEVLNNGFVPLEIDADSEAVKNGLKVPVFGDSNDEVPWEIKVVDFPN